MHTLPPDAASHHDTPLACRTPQRKTALAVDTPAKQTVEVIIVITNI